MTTVSHGLHHNDISQMTRTLRKTWLIVHNRLKYATQGPIVRILPVLQRKGASRLSGAAPRRAFSRNHTADKPAR